MVLVLCEDCGSEYSSDARRCVHCGARKATTHAIRNFLLAVVAAIFLIAQISMAVNGTSGPVPRLANENAHNDDDGSLDYVACGMAQKAVTFFLKAPSTAKFPDCAWDNAEYDITVDKDHKRVRVRGYVDAQNAFGATLRKKWLVELNHRDGPAGRWSVSNITMN